MYFEISENSNSTNIETDLNIPILDKNNLTYEDFFRNFMIQNKPCIIKDITENWDSSKLWLTTDGINYDYLEKQYGHMNVTIYDCLQKEYNSQKCYESTLKKYLYYFKNFHRNSDSSEKLEYLKNWHLKLNTDDNFYEVPLYFASDWLNEYCVDCLKDDYRFVYMGMKNTWTPFHADVFSSYSWSANICGRKKWILFPPGEELVYKDSLGNLPYDISSEDLTLVKHVEIIQGPGEVIFVPSNWHHQVWNLGNTISINHNWVNGCNIKIMYDSMKSNLASIEDEIEDCKSMEDFKEHCQLMLNTLFGMDFYKFYDFLKYIALNRIRLMEKSCEKVLFHGHQIGDNHIKFDLNAIRCVLLEFIEHEEVCNFEYFKNVDIVPWKLLEQIESVVNI